MRRRSVLTGIGTTGIVSITGCLGSVKKATSFKAAVAGVEQSALDETGYKHEKTEEIGIEREIEVAGQSQTVSVTNQLRQYSKTVDFGVLGEKKMGLFAVFATPKVDVLEKSFNPVSEMPPGELVRLVSSNYEGMGDVEFDSESTVTILGEEVTDSRYVSEASLGEQKIDLRLHVTEAVARGDDLVVTIGGYPEKISEQEQENIIQLMKGVLPAGETVPNGNTTGNQ